jgi:hypothetical protein
MGRAEEEKERMRKAEGRKVIRIAEDAERHRCQTWKAGMRRTNREVEFKVKGEWEGRDLK